MTDMLKKSEKINISDTYVKSDNLTEQWKRGELESGYYYIVTKYATFPNRIDFYNSSPKVWSYHSNDYIDKILAPVPSYEQWQAKLEENTKLKGNIHSMLFTDDVVQNRYDKAKEENAQLKELLKECREVLKLVAGETIYFPRTVDICINKINQVLGEE